mgnify:CR=1 FL=1
MKHLAVILLVILTAQGCAQFQHAVEVTPERFTDAKEDPVRRVHIGVQASHLISTGGVTLTCAAILSPTIVGILVCPVVGFVYNYLTYEYILEPWSKARVRAGKPSLVGPYWERGAQDGEVFRNE